jgi:capsular polysaccharide transport system ATP-binding protein
MAVAKSFAGKGRAPTIVFRPTTVTLPGDRRMAILGGRNEGKTVLLQLLARTERPDLGQVIAPLRLSPVVNADRLFHPNLSGLENIRFYARRFGVDEERLLLAMDSFMRLGPILEQRVGGLAIRERRGMEAALAAALAFDCYLIDDLGMLGPDLAERAFQIATRRRAGVIFATGSPRLARQFADCAVVIQGHTLHPFNSIGEATRFYERE